MKDVSILTENGVNIKKSLELFGDMETYDSTLEVFLQEVDGKIKSIKNYKEIGDMTNYATLVHSLKSDAKYFGFEALAEIAYQHELESKANNMYYVTEHFDSLMVEADRIINLVKKYMGRAYVEVKEEVEVKKSNEKTILVVDDSNIIRNFIYKIFKNDFEVLVADDGKEALDLINNSDDKNICAILLDLNMPNINGFEVLDYLQKNDLLKKYPVSIITGVDDKESINKAFKYQIVDMLLKPFNERDVKRIVEKGLSGN